MQQHGDARDGIADAGLISEGHEELQGFTVIPEVHQAGVAAHRSAGDIDRRGWFIVPDQCPAGLEPRTGAHLAEEAIQTGSDDASGPMEQRDLLRQFRTPVVQEALVVGITEVGEHADGRLNDELQLRHFLGLAHAGLEDAQGVFGSHLPDAERYAHLAVPASRAADDAFLATQELE